MDDVGDDADEGGDGDCFVDGGGTDAEYDAHAELPGSRDFPKSGSRNARNACFIVLFLADLLTILECFTNSS